MLEVAWPEGCVGAVSMVLDGGLPEHLEIARSLTATATFCVTPECVLKNPKEWQTLAKQGHEIGNCCLFGVTDGGRLPNWSLRTVEQELHMTQQFLQDLFPWQAPVTFSYPGQSTQCANGDYRTLIPNQFLNGVSHERGTNLSAAEATFLKVDESPQAGAWTILRLSQEELPDCTGFWLATVQEVADFLRAEDRNASTP